MTVVWEGVDRHPLEVVVDAPLGTTAADLVVGLRELVGAAVPPGPVGSTWSLHANGAPVDGAAPVGEDPLVDGAVLTVSSVRERAALGARRNTSPLTLAVISGPDAGREFPLLPGTVRLGRGASADLTVADPDLSRSHVLVTVTTDGVHVRDDGSTNGTRIADRPVPDGGQPLRTSDTVAVGSSRLQVRAPRRRPAAVTQPREGVRLVNRSPRMPRPVQPRTFALPPEPQRPHRGRLPWVAMLAPLPVGAVLAVLFSPAMLAFALMSPLLMGATVLSDRVQGRRTYAVQLAEHAAAVRRVRASALVAVAEEWQARQLGFPDPAEVLAVASRPSTRLWERRREDPDVLDLRLGTWTARSQVRVVAPGPDVEPEVLETPDAPCAVHLGSVGILGVAGPSATTEAVGRNLVGQVAVLHSHRDVTLWVLVARRANCAAWQWVSRLPHNRASDGSRRLACLEADESATVTAVQTLLGEVEQRQRSIGSAQPWLGPRAVVVLVGAGELREVPGVATLLDEGPAVGVAVIALDHGAGRLPSECRAVVESVSPGSRTAWRLTTAEDDASGHSLVVDQVGPWWADRLSRALAPLRDSTPDEASEMLPDTVRLLDLLRFDAVDPEAVVRQWTGQPATTAAPLGVTTGGPCTIDLRRDGPHVLVGGTTGAGKSELLRTLIAGLAAGNRPDRLAFVLVDYKGGAAFRECASLPHTTGLVTDLDAHLTARALTSLTAELKRREALLASVGARDLDEWDQQRGTHRPPLPRLVIVIDEFRALAEEYPDFIAGLVRIAAVGRSLGVHLVLATQRPAGVVSADIKANVNLRIALRVRDRADSDDVIDSAAAAGISEQTPGRAFARSGSAPPQPFQTATLIGGRPAPRRLTVTAADWTGGAPRAASHHETAGPPGAPPDGAGDLVDLVGSLRAASAILAVTSTPPPWLPPLPERLAAEDVRQSVGASGSLVPLGLVDRPSQQRQEPLVWDLAQPGHWAAIGTGGSGRTGFLRVLAHEAAERLSPAQLHLYAVDGGRGGLQDLAVLPHTGAVVSRDDPGRLERLVRRLEGEVARRRRLASRLLGQPPAPAPATMLLLVDDWDLVTHDLDSVDHGVLTERLVSLLREGSAVGLRAAVTGDRGLLHGRLSSLFTERLVLRLADPADAVLVGLSRTALPVAQPPGRGVLSSDGAEVQLALPAAGQLSVVAARRHEPSQGQTPHQGPLRVEPLPSHVALDGLLDAALTSDSRDSGQVVVGVGGDDLHPVGLDPERDGALWLVAGSTRSGKSTALRTLGEGLLRAGRPVAVVSTRPGPMDRLRDRPGVACWSSDDDPDTVVAACRDNPGLAVLVDDADQLLDTAVEPVLRDLARAARQGQGLVACAASTSTLLTQYRGVAVEVARSQVGLLLSPRGVADGELFGLASGRRHAAPDRLPGRGLLGHRRRSGRGAGGDVGQGRRLQAASAGLSERSQDEASPERSEVPAAAAAPMPVTATAATATAMSARSLCTSPHATGRSSRFHTMVGVLGQSAPATQNRAIARRPTAKTATSTTSITTRDGLSDPDDASSTREKTQKPSRNNPCSAHTALATTRGRSTLWDEGRSDGLGAAVTGVRLAERPWSSTAQIRRRSVLTVTNPSAKPARFLQETPVKTSRHL